ncbi:MAG: response regulator [Euryarchaeota archaeon]|nr:response regulator [Euryarchaeota archaeon]
MVTQTARAADDGRAVMTGCDEREAPEVRLVIAEDRPVARKLIIDELSGIAGFEIVGTAQDGRQAVDLVRALSPDVVLLDLVMPELDGIEAMERIRAFSDVGIILLTGSRFDTDTLERAARKKGADGFFLKPSGSVSVDLYRIRDGLVSEIRRLARRRQAS